jgi:gamma-tubulin complex component 5
MDSCQSWSDFHFLNTAFRDVVEASTKKWIDPLLVRLSYRGSSDKAGTRTVQGIDPLLVEYAVPFPLTYIFGPRAIQTYSSVFVWLVQIRRAQGALESISLRGAAGMSGSHRQSDLKLFYAMRSKLSWFVK